MVGKYAYLNPLEDGQFEALDVAEHNMHEWVRRHSNSGDLATTVPTLPQLEMSSLLQEDSGSAAHDPARRTAAIESSSGTDELTPSVVTESKTAVDLSDEDPATVVSEEKISASSTIETVVSLHSSMLLVSLCGA